MAVGLARALVTRGIRSVLIALDEGGDLEPVIRSAGVEQHIIGGRRLRDPRYYWRVAKVLRRISPDVVHSHNFSALLHTGVSRQLARVPRMVHTEHAFEYLAAKPHYHRWIRAASRGCDQFVVVGERVLPFFRDSIGITPSRLRVIRNGVDLSVFRPPPNVGELRRELGLSDTTFAVGTAGRLAPEKDLAVLVRAVEHVRRVRGDVTLLLVGEGSERVALQQLVATSGLTDHVRFLGWRTDVARIVSALDLFVLSSQHEGLPLALLEAMALAVPVASTPVGEIPNVVEDGVTGRLFPVGDSRALADIVLELAAGEPLRRALASAGRGVIERDYNHELMVDRYVDAYGFAAAGDRRDSPGLRVPNVA